jgi:hypothetical protein
MTANKLNRFAIAKIDREKLVARWLLDKNSRLYCQWILEDCEVNSHESSQNLCIYQINRKIFFASYIPFDR